MFCACAQLPNNLWTASEPVLLDSGFVPLHFSSFFCPCWLFRFCSADVASRLRPMGLLYPVAFCSLQFSRELFLSSSSLSSPEMGVTVSSCLFANVILRRVILLAVSQYSASLCLLSQPLLHTGIFSADMPQGHLTLGVTPH